jgi:hypothetical protein
MSNTITWNKFDYVARMRNRINAPTAWKDVLNVKYSNNRAIINSSMTTEPSVVTGTRGTAYGYQDFTLSADTLTISNYRNIPILIDEADRFQQSYVDQMKIAEFQGKKINEYIEGQFLGQHASWTDFGVADLISNADDTTAITVSAGNVDDIMRAVKRKLYFNNGVDMAVENGVCIVWRATDFELLEGFVQANGFTEADIALKNGIPVQKGFYYGGITHYLSNSHTAGHVFAGIKKTGEVGILSGTYGQAKFIEDPGLVSGLGIVSRVDYGFNFPTYNAEFVMDVNVA